MEDHKVFLPPGNARKSIFDLLILFLDVSFDIIVGLMYMVCRSCLGEVFEIWILC